MSEKETDPKKENDEEETAGLQKVTDLDRISTSLDFSSKSPSVQRFITMCLCNTEQTNAPQY